MSYSQKLDDLREKAKNDFYFFCKEILGYSDMEIQPHKELCEFISHWDKRKKLILLPRGSFKSTVATVSYALYCLCQDPNERIMIATENYQNSSLYLKEIKNHIESNETLKALYGDMKPISGKDGDWTKTEITVSTKTRTGGKEPSIQISSLGTVKVGLHFSKLILDDLVSNQNTNTKEQMDKVIDYYKYLLSIADPGSKLVIIGTRYHYGDLYAYIQENEQDNFNMLIKGAYNDDGSLYFPTRLTEDFLQEQRKSQGGFIFSCQYMNQAVDAENQCFKEEHLQFFQTPPSALNHYITIDPACTTGRESDFTAILVLGVDCDNNIFVLENHQLKVSPSDWIDVVFDKVLEYKIHTEGGMVSLETNALQQIYKKTFDLEMEKRQVWFGLYESKPGGTSRSKEKRISALQPLFERGKIFLRKNQHSLIDQLLRFPKAKNDDQIDALKDVIPIMNPADGIKPLSKLDMNKDLTDNEKQVWKSLDDYTRNRRVKRMKYRRI